MSLSFVGKGRCLSALRTIRLAVWLIWPGAGNSRIPTALPGQVRTPAPVCAGRCGARIWAPTAWANCRRLGTIRLRHLDLDEFFSFSKCGGGDFRSRREGRCRMQLALRVSAGFLERGEPGRHFGIERQSSTDQTG